VTDRPSVRHTLFLSNGAESGKQKISSWKEKPADIANFSIVKNKLKGVQKLARNTNSSKQACNFSGYEKFNLKQLSVLNGASLKIYRTHFGFPVEFQRVLLVYIKFTNSV
jgi:hypothetical protein